MTREHDSAKEIYQDLLDAIGQAVADRDFVAFAPHISLPHQVSTAETTVLVETRSDLKGLFDTMVGRMDREGVERMTRLCTLAEYAGPDTIRGTHDTWLVTPKNEIRDSYIALSTLKWRGDRWYVHSSSYVGKGRTLPDAMVEDFAARSVVVPLRTSGAN